MGIVVRGKVMGGLLAREMPLNVILSAMGNHCEVLTGSDLHLPELHRLLCNN